MEKRGIIISLAVIVITVVFYFFPILKGKVIFQYDIVSGGAQSQALYEYKEKFGELPLWNPRLFSGMPTMYMGTEIKGNLGEKIIYHLRGHLFPIIIMILGLIAFFILLLLFDVNPYLSMGAAIAFGFFSYNIQIIEAGHVTKFMNIMAIPWLLLGLAFLFHRKNIPWGIIVLAIGIPLHLSSGHVQIAYYAGFIAGIYWIYELIKYVKEKEIKAFVIKTLIAVVLAIASLMMYAPKYLPMQEYTKYSIRGPSELVRDKKANRGAGGLDKDYAYSWSYSRAELLTLVAPGAMGEGSTYPLGEDSEFYRWLVQHNVPDAYRFAQTAPTYWGEQPFVSGGIYLGATIITLFIVALYFDTPLIAPFLISTLLGILLALGRHSVSIFSGFVILFLPIIHNILRKKVKIPPYKLGTLLGFLALLLLIMDPGGYRLIDLLFDYFPLFNKFRVPTTHLVIVSFAAPIVAAIGTNNFIKQKDWNYIKERLVYASLVTLGSLLLLWLFGSELFSFRGPNDAKFQFPNELLNALKSDRISMFKKDILRAVIFSGIALALLWGYAKKVISSINVLTAVLALTIMIDNISVARRYLNKEHFVEPVQVEQAKTPRDYVQILQQDTTYFRIFPLSENPFNDGHTPYYLNSIGGYSPAKLKRYQQLIEAHISRGVPNVLNMLNTKYIVTTDTLPFPTLRPIQRTQTGKIIYLNLTNYGAAWITPNVIVVDIPDQALDTLDNIYSKNTAVIEKKDQKFLTDFDKSPVDSNEYIKLVYYDNMKYIYEYNSPKKRFVTFSEIYYPGWKLYVDGKETHVFQTNFVLRGAIIPAGKHRLEFRFEPDFVKTSEMLGYTGSFIWFLAIFVALFLLYKEYRKSKTNN